MTLRVGVVSGRQLPTEGGGWTFVAGISGALKRVLTRNDYLFVDDMIEREDAAVEKNWDSRNLPRRILRRAFREGIGMARKIAPQGLRRLVVKTKDADGYPELLQAVVEQQKLDMVWFITQASVPVRGPFIVTVWDLEHREQPCFPEVSVTGWRWMERERHYKAVLPRASFVITGTQAGKEQVVRYYGVNPKNVKVIQFPIPEKDLQLTSVDILALREKYQIKGDFLFYPAQFWPHKNHINLLLALDILRKRNGLRVNLVLTGSDKGNRRYVLEKVSEWGLSDQVFDLGFVSREELNTLYGNALALVFPSFFGPDNLPPLEAFSLACPVIASRITGAEEQLSGGALLFDPADPVDIADKVLAVTADAALRSRLTGEGAKIALLRTPERYIAQVEEILDGFAAIRRCWGLEYRHI